MGCPSSCRRHAWCRCERRIGQRPVRGGRGGNRGKAAGRFDDAVRGGALSSGRSVSACAGYSGTERCGRGMPWNAAGCRRMRAAAGRGLRAAISCDVGPPQRDSAIRRRLCPCGRILWSYLHQVVLYGIHDQIGGVRAAGLGKYVRAMLVDRTFRNEQLVCDLLVGESFAYLQQHL